jgi:hypothetical protein
MDDAAVMTMIDASNIHSQSVHFGHGVCPKAHVPSLPPPPLWHLATMDSSTCASPILSVAFHEKRLGSGKESVTFVA